MTRIRTGSLIQVSPKGPSLRFHIDPESASLQEGVGGWRQVDRPRLVQALEWTGRPVHTLEMALMFGTEFDPADSTTEQDCQRLTTMGQPGREGADPPILQVQYLNLGSMRWVMDSLEWSEEYWINNRRIRAIATVKFLEYHSIILAGNPVKPKPARATTSGTSSGSYGGAALPVKRPKTYTVRAGDTWGAIATRTSTNTKALQQANPDGHTPPILRVGTVLRIPGT